MTQARTSQPFDLIAGATCLDFANTVGGLRGIEAHERLHDYRDLVVWSEQAGVVAAGEAHRLLRDAARRQAEADVIFARAIALREAIYRVFTALVEHHEPSPSDLAILNTELARATVWPQVSWVSGAFVSTWEHDDDALDAMLWHIARSAAELLTSSRVGLLRQCSSDTCGWLFVDTTRNRSRRWCDMRGCGNREKVRRHRTRARQGLERSRD